MLTIPSRSAKEIHAWHSDSVSRPGTAINCPFDSASASATHTICGDSACFTETAGTVDLPRLLSPFLSWDLRIAILDCCVKPVPILTVL